MLYHCKMCGGLIELEPGMVVGVCKHCGTKQTLPLMDDDRRANLYDRANYFRFSHDYDKAARIYEKIISRDKTDAEAYWSLILCRYGVEYVKDSATHQYVPRINRTQIAPILDDQDYQRALHYADSFQRQIYEQEAYAISKVQMNNLLIAKSQEPYDIFLCYKETDSAGRQTHDCALADIIRQKLTQEGFRVFSPRVSLENMKGIDYEPYIFAALTTAKMMIVLGTKPEHFHAVGVKNKWSRFLTLADAGEGEKRLIIAYKDMNRYDLPEELSDFPALDMSGNRFTHNLFQSMSELIQQDTNKTDCETVYLPTEKTVSMDSGDENTGLLTELNHDKNEKKSVTDDDVPAGSQIAQNAASIDGPPERMLRTEFEGKPADEQILVRQGEADRIEKKEGQNNQKHKQESGQSVSREESAGKRKKAALVLIPIIVSCIAFILVLIIVIIPSQKRNKAMSLLAAGEYEAGYELLEQLGDHAVVVSSKKDRATVLLDSGEYEAAYALLEEIDQHDAVISNQYDRAIALLDSGDYETAYALLEGLNYKDSNAKLDEIKLQRKKSSFMQAEVGSYVCLGSYEQDNNVSNGKEEVEWLVLAKENHKMLVISRYALDCKQYNTSDTDTTWETCSLRKWLNETFIRDTFSQSEQNLIQTTEVIAGENPSYDTPAGNDTYDKLFLLSISEANQYFRSNLERQCQGTAYCFDQGADKLDDDHCWWWLRSPGYNATSISYVYSDGSVTKRGTSALRFSGAIRPALWIELEP